MQDSVRNCAIAKRTFAVISLSGRISIDVKAKAAATTNEAAAMAFSDLRETSAIVSVVFAVVCWRHPIDTYNSVACITCNVEECCLCELALSEVRGNPVDVSRCYPSSEFSVIVVNYCGFRSVPVTTNNNFESACLKVVSRHWLCQLDCTPCAFCPRQCRVSLHCWSGCWDWGCQKPSVLSEPPVSV